MKEKRSWAFNPFIAVGIIRRSDDKYLLVNHKNMKKWAFPGGHIEPNDSPDYTIVKELWEELGIHVTKVNQLYAKHINFIENDRPQARFAYWFDILEYKGVPFNKAKHEHKNLEYFSIDELRQFDKNKLAETVIYWLKEKNE